MAVVRNQAPSDVLFQPIVLAGRFTCSPGGCLETSSSPSLLELHGKEAVVGGDCADQPRKVWKASKWVHRRLPLPSLKKSFPCYLPLLCPNILFVLPILLHTLESLDSLCNLANLSRIKVHHDIAKLQHPFFP